MSTTHRLSAPSFLFFFFNDTATTEIYTLSLHDALPICPPSRSSTSPVRALPCLIVCPPSCRPDRKSTRLNSSHLVISYAVFCLKKKDNHKPTLASHFLNVGVVPILPCRISSRPRLPLIL